MVMNINRTSMAACGFSPPTRVFEVAGAGACLLCDEWRGIDSFFEPGKEILVIGSAEEVAAELALHDESARKRVGMALRERALRDHTYAQRALQAEFAFRECLARKRPAMTKASSDVEAMTGEFA
jgi:spore maturation protein CgeB